MIVTCPRCAASTSITAAEPVLVTCLCSCRFVAGPLGDGTLVDVELREIAFRCAVTAQRFFIVFGRLSQHERFSIALIHGEPGRLGRALAHQDAELPLPQRPVVAAATAPPADRSPPRPGRSGTAVVAATGPRAQPPHLAGWLGRAAEVIVAWLAPGVDDGPFNTAEFDYAGFRCLYCASPPAALFARCYKCREPVCFGRGDVGPAGQPRLHRCTTVCGATGYPLQRRFAVSGEEHRLPVSSGATAALGEAHQPALAPDAAHLIGRVRP